MGTLYKRADHDPRTAVWYAAYVGWDGRRVRRSTNTRSKAAAQQILAKWETEESKRRHGVIDVALEEQKVEALRPIGEHITEWLNSVRTAGKTDKYLVELERVINAIVAEGKWTTIRDIRSVDVERYAVNLAKNEKRSNRTIGKHIGFAKQFGTWLAVRGRLPGNPLQGIKKPNPETDRRVERRALTFDEWPHLIQATRSAGKRGELTAEARGLLYEFAVQTGLRQNEVRSITPGKLKLEHAPPYALVPKSTTKNAQLARQYLTACLARRLTKFVQAKRGSAQVFQLPHESLLADVLRADLATARKAWIEAGKTEEIRQKREESDFLAAKNHEGHVIDFHSLRHTCGTWLALSGENIKTVQSIMRHSTITLTMDRYGHLFPAMDAEAVQRLEGRFARER